MKININNIDEAKKALAQVENFIKTEEEKEKKNEKLEAARLDFAKSMKNYGIALSDGKIDLDVKEIIEDLKVMEKEMLSMLSIVQKTDKPDEFAKILDMMRKGW